MRGNYVVVGWIHHWIQLKLDVCRCVQRESDQPQCVAVCCSVLQCVAVCCTSNAWHLCNFRANTSLIWIEIECVSMYATWIAPNPVFYRCNAWQVFESRVNTSLSSRVNTSLSSIEMGCASKYEYSHHWREYTHRWRVASVWIHK